MLQPRPSVTDTPCVPAPWHRGWLGIALYLAMKWASKRVGSKRMMGAMSAQRQVIVATPRRRSMARTMARTAFSGGSTQKNCFGLASSGVSTKPGRMSDT